MTRLAISFTLAMLLVIGLLGAYLRESYVDARDVLVERIDADLTQLSTDNLLQRIGVLKSNQANSVPFDTVINIKTVPTDDSAFAGFDDLDLSVRVYDTTQLDAGESGNTDGALRQITRHLIVNGKDLAPQLDSLSGVYGVRLQEYASVEVAQRDRALVVRNRVGLLASQLNRDGPVIAMVGYRSAVVQTLGFELVSAVLLLLALGFAAYSAYRSLREHRRQLADREALLANLSHELKTPIAAVSVALEALDRFGADAQPDRRRDYINLSRQELGRLDRLADYAIGALKLNDGDAHGAREPVEVAEVARDIWSGLCLQYGIDRTALTLITRGKSAPVYLYAQEFRLALSNLLDNAIKYGGDPPAVRLLLEYAPGAFACSVADGGPGVPASESIRIFERFYRITDEGAGHAVKGHGLGLSLVRQVADLHGGTVGVRRNDAGGATFDLRIPLP